jgi:hypothetical protein
MWLFTRYGFFSIVCARKGFGESGQPVDPDQIMVRGRSREHLEQLQKRFPSLVDLSIESFPRSDYPFRLFLPKPVWADVMKDLAEELDYDNFKSEVARQLDSSHYLDCLHDVWGIMRRLEKK